MRQEGEEEEEGEVFWEKEKQKRVRLGTKLRPRRELIGLSRRKSQDIRKRQERAKYGV
jgi:hypothetical protein